jgi:uncharacterized membrane protein
MIPRMDWYELFLLVHIAGAIVWLGSGFLLQVQAYRAERTEDAEGLRRIAADSAALGNTVFVPASLTVLVFGILMVVDGPWTFDSLWIVLALAGYAGTFLFGVLVAKPVSERLAAMLERDGLTPQAILEIRKLLAMGRADSIGLYAVLTIMALKPTGDDVALLVVLAAALGGAIVLAAQRVRALEAEAAAAQPSLAAA